MIPYLPPHPNTSPILRTHPPFHDGTRRRRKAAGRIGLTSVAVAAALSATAAQADAASNEALGERRRGRSGRRARGGVAGLIMPEVDLGADG